MNTYKALENKGVEIENELKRIGWWGDAPCPVNLSTCTEAFCSDKLAFSQWLQFVLVPDIQTIVAEKKPLPKRSMIGVKAMREYDYMDHVEEAETLAQLLSELDDICNSQVEM